MSVFNSPEMMEYYVLSQAEEYIKKHNISIKLLRSCSLPEDFTENEITTFYNLIKTEHLFEIFEGLTSYPIINSDKWIQNQPIPLFKEAAKCFVDNIKYIEIKDVLESLYKVSKDLLPVYSNSVIILGTQKKSNYFFGLLLSSHMYLEYNLEPLGFFKTFIYAEYKYGLEITYIDVDDMMYTGSQTINMLYRVSNAILSTTLHTSCAPLLNSCINLVLKHRYLKDKLSYKLVRLYMSSFAISQCYKYTKLLIPFELVYSKEVPNFAPSESAPTESAPKTMSITNYLIIRIFFNTNVASSTCAYFDHKIADISSTTNIPLVLGYIPSTNIIKKILDTCDDYIYEILKEFDAKIHVPDFKQRIRSQLSEDCEDYKFISLIKEQCTCGAALGECTLRVLPDESMIFNCFIDSTESAPSVSASEMHQPFHYII